MASVSVVHFNTSPHKVLQQQNNTSNSNNNNSNNSDRREIIVLRKTPQILPQPKDYTKGDILITNTGRKKSRTGKEIRTQPQPIAVARRNARERNRVKQVNNGFANLRQHIPNFIAATFESNARGGNKKLSKVETLRMAVEYIRSLEDLLAMDHDNNSENLSNSSAFSSPPPSSLPSTASTTANNLQYHQIMSPPTDDDDLSSNPTSSPQYIRIDTTTYQIIPSHLYDDSENLEPLNILSEADLEFSNSQDLLQSIHSDSLSPGIYSEQSLSPGIIEKDSTQRYQQIFQDDGNLVQIKTEIGAEIPVMSLKTEQELPQQCKSNVINVMQWWEQQQQQQQQENQPADNIS